MKRLLLIICLLPVMTFGQFSGVKKLLLQQGGNIGSSILTVSAIETTDPTSSVSKFITVKDNSDYISEGVKYINEGVKFINPTDYSSRSYFNPIYPLYNVYHRFMRYSPYRSIWTNEALQQGNKLELTKSLYFDSEKTIHIGIFADNFFDLYVNGDTLAITNRSTNPNNQFLTFFHLFAITTQIGWNTISLSGESDGTVLDALGFVVLDNTKSEVYDNPISKDNWNILWTSEEYIGETINIATCPSGYNYDDVNDYCFVDVPETEVSVGNIVSFSPIIDGNSIVNPVSWTMYYGDGSSYSGSTVTSQYQHIYTSSGTFKAQYVVHTTNNTFFINKNITVN